MPQTDKTKLFYLLPPPPPFSYFDFIASRKAHLLHFLTLFDRSPYLVLLGARPTVLCHSLEKYESSAFLSGRPPTVKIITFPIAYRQPPPLKAKSSNFPTFFSYNFRNFGKFKLSLRNFRKSRILYKIPNLFDFEQDSSDFGNISSIQRPLLSKERNADGISINIEIVD